MTEPEPPPLEQPAASPFPILPPDDPAFPRHARWMEAALAEADAAAAADEVPVGAVVVYQERILAVGRNRREERQDPLAHAEVVAIQEASRALGTWRLEECTLYVTLEPCPMCAGAILQARVPTVVYAADDAKAGAAVSLYQLLSDLRLNHRCEVVRGVLADRAREQLRAFFRAKRALGKK